MLGPYLHPYKHYPTASARLSEARDEVVKRCIFDNERSWEKAGTWTVGRDELEKAMPSGITRTELFWALDDGLGEDVAGAIKSWRQRSPEVREVKIVQASPSNQVIELVNLVSHFLGLAAQQHHGAVLSEAIAGLGVSPEDECVQIESMPAHLDLDKMPSDQKSRAFASLMCRVRFPELCAESDFIVQLVQNRLEKL